MVVRKKVGSIPQMLHDHPVGFVHVCLIGIGTSVRAELDLVSAQARFRPRVARRGAGTWQRSVPISKRRRPTESHYDGPFPTPPYASRGIGAEPRVSTDIDLDWLCSRLRL